MQLKPDVEAIFEFMEDKRKKLYDGYRPAHLVYANCLTTGLHSYYNLDDDSNKQLKGTITFVSPEDYPACLWIGKRLAMYEGKEIIGYATIMCIFNPVLCMNEGKR